ncbi:MAG: glutamate--tRNA ligase, partial [Candidatus Nanohaloarchaea archaeon]|nr:glutamate--tRNA ligase [Candidatus Nanohaloarchaea archaeon]
VRMNKAVYLCRMAEACFELALGRREADDKDHYANKRLKVSGDLMKDLIRKYAVRNAAKFGEAEKEAVIGKVFAENPDLKQDAETVVEETEEVIKEVNELSDEELQAEKESYEYEDEQDEEKDLPDLENVPDDGVVMRMAPFPSGMLHIGNARMAVLNDEFVKRYGGKLYLVIDDTAGSEEKKPVEEAYEEIPKDLEWLGIEFDEIVYKSDRLELFYEYAEQFLEEGWAYVCECDAETLRENREEGIACEHRDESAEENLQKWQRMLDGEYEEGEAVVRLKTDMQHDDPAFRDRVLLRVSELDHPRVGEEYHVWPMLEFSWAIDDHELGMTHILRGQDLVMEDKMEQYMWDLLGWEHPEIVHHGLLSIEDIKISTSQSQRKIEEGEYMGWHDPRTWSLKSLKKRGFEPEAIRNFVTSFGLSISNVKVPVDTLYTENRKLIDEEADRYFFLEEPTEIEIRGMEEDTTANPDLHPEDPERGNRELTVEADDGAGRVLLDRSDIEEGRELRLKDLCNIRVTGEGTAERIDPSLDYALDNDLQIVQWLPANGTKTCEIIMPDGSTLHGKCEQNLTDKDQIIQFIRFGFVRVDECFDEKALCYFTHQ